MTFYLDESGHSGDLVNCGGRYDFTEQPFFVLAAVGLGDEAAIATNVAELRKQHKISPGELKSRALQAKPKFVADIINKLYQNHVPLFVEVVDKRYFICTNITTFQLLSPSMGFQQNHDLFILQNKIADVLYSKAPSQVFGTFVEACLAPSDMKLLTSFYSMREFCRTAACTSGPGENGFFDILLCIVEDALASYQEQRRNDAEAYLRFLPPPDRNKHNRCVWMLPNLTSFTNIYARLNLFYGRKLNGVHIVHDQQLEIDDILQLGKTSTEKLQEVATNCYTPHSDFVFEQIAKLYFVQSHESIGIQLADVVAGAVMRYFRDSLLHKSMNADLSRAIKMMINGSDGRTGYGINQVIP
ncbi:DUF3800 domain-containing protein [Acidithiobacillus ferriphilus]|uniref:DUF3800 domain-containing protein n=1 Tax=Acidithiobacillus ferriphilus TaxID=1689834 RepID=UPI0040566107